MARLNMRLRADNSRLMVPLAAPSPCRLTMYWASVCEVISLALNLSTLSLRRFTNYLALRMLFFLFTS